jgi:23S rRNA (pseudouridine1915-N3)-methyltransferase
VARVARELVFAWVGRPDRGRTRAPYHSLCQDYQTRIARFTAVRAVTVRPRRVEPERQLEVEGQALLAALPQPSRLVALDRRGTSRSSLDLAAWLGRLVGQWPHALCFLIGSDLGLAPTVLDQAPERLSLGPLTLPHELARLVLLEQIYRSLAIQHGIKYHRAPFRD